MRLLHQIFEIQAKLEPEAPALQFAGDEPITYKQLNENANQLANYLAAEEGYRIKKGDRVLMSIPRCAEQVTVLLALSKLGAVYVPTDINCPSGRVEKIIKDVEAKCTIAWSDLSSDKVEEVVSEFSDDGSQTDNSAGTVDEDSNNDSSSTIPREVCYLEPLIRQNILLGYPVENLDKEDLSVDDLLYIIYTSGTTGTPKGVPIKHAGIGYWASIIKNQFEIDSSRKVLGYISTGFDAHIWEYLMAWVGGAALHLVPDEARTNTDALKAFIQAHGITDATLIPTTLSNMDLSTFLSDEETKLKTIYSTGEACTADIVSICENSNVDLWNCYGPTEATFGISVLKITEAMLTEDGKVPIGDPVNEVSIRILDKNNQPVADGEPGQLFICSPYLTDGYLNRFNETNSRFQKIDGDRLYATQDRFVRQDGMLHYLGRNSLDSQIKIRGQLVNLFEVEELLCSVEGIRNACVLVVEKNGINFLVAYVQTDGSELTDKEIVHIKTSLSAHLIPAAIPAQLLLIDELPQTTNGKVDRRQLQQRYQQIPHSELQTFIPIEEKVAGIMCEVLGIESFFDEKATFFTLGGNSMLLTRLKEKIREEFDVSLSSSELYKRDLTIAGLAKLIQRVRCRTHEHSPEQISVSGDNDSNIFMFHDITGDGVSIYQEMALELAKTARSNIYGMNARGLSEEDDISRGIDVLAEDYANSMQDLQEQGPYTLMGWSFGGVLAWKVAEILEARDQEVNLVVIDSISPSVYQKCSTHVFAEVLVDRINKLAQLFDIKGVESIGSSELARSPTQQLQYVFRHLTESNNDERVSKVLKLIFALMTANENYSPKKLNSIPLVIRCNETVAEMKEKLLPDQDDMVYGTLGWSHVQDDILTRPAVDSTHLDLLHNDSVTSLISRFLESKALLQNHSDNSSGVAAPDEVKKYVADEVKKAMEEHFQTLTQILMLAVKGETSSQKTASTGNSNNNVLTLFSELNEKQSEDSETLPNAVNVPIP